MWKFVEVLSQILFREKTVKSLGKFVSLFIKTFQIVVTGYLFLFYRRWAFNLSCIKPTAKYALWTCWLTPLNPNISRIWRRREDIYYGLQRAYFFLDDLFTFKILCARPQSKMSNPITRFYSKIEQKLQTLHSFINTYYTRVSQILWNTI